MSRWFRHYAGMARDDKIVRASLKAGQPIERTAWVWAAILESAAEIDDGGRFELDPAEVAYFLRADGDDIARILSALADGGRIAGDVVVHWSDRQFQSDRSAERQRRHRDRQKASRDGSREYEHEEGQRHGDVSVARAPEGFFAPARYRLPRHLWEPLRASIFERDDYTCRYCGERGGRLECDHVLPVSRGGPDHPDNLVTACFSCNRSKRNKTLSEWVQ